MKTFHKKGLKVTVRNDGIRIYTPFVIFKSKIWGFIPDYTKYVVKVYSGLEHSDRNLGPVYELQECYDKSKGWSDRNKFYATNILNNAIIHMQNKWQEEYDGKTKKVEIIYL